MFGLAGPQPAVKIPTAETTRAERAGQRNCIASLLLKRPHRLRSTNAAHGATPLADIRVPNRILSCWRRLFRRARRYRGHQGRGLRDLTLCEMLTPAGGITSRGGRRLRPPCSPLHASPSKGYAEPCSLRSCMKKPPDRLGRARCARGAHRCSRWAICRLLCCFRPQRSLEGGPSGQSVRDCGARQETDTIL